MSRVRWSSPKVFTTQHLTPVEYRSASGTVEHVTSVHDYMGSERSFSHLRCADRRHRYDSGNVASKRSVPMHTSSRKHTLWNNIDNPETWCPPGCVARKIGMSGQKQTLSTTLRPHTFSGRGGATPCPGAAHDGCTAKAPHPAQLPRQSGRRTHTPSHGVTQLHHDCANI